MSLSFHRTCILNPLLSVCAIGCLLSSCTIVGPTAIRSGRLAYNNFITQTNNELLLMTVIHDRYEERSTMLAVSSVTANVSVSTSTGVQLGFGSSSNYAGNLVPFSAGTVYEENPTISYTPVEGEKYIQRLFAPVSIRVLAQLLGTVPDPAALYVALISRVNGIQNPEFLFSSVEPDPRFSRFVEIMTALTQANRVQWVEDQSDQNFYVVIDRYAPTYTAEVQELLDLLGMPAVKERSAKVILPVSLSMEGVDGGGIELVTRSVFRLGKILSAAIEVPEKTQRDGITASYPPLGLVGNKLRVRYAAAEPQHTSVAVPYREGWFYIDETDQATKRFFRLLGTLWSNAMAESTDRSLAVPALTIPVSK